MPKLTIDVPDALWSRMQGAHEDWSAIAAKAFEAHLAQQQRESYAHGYSWARDRAPLGDLKAMVDARTYKSAANVVRNTAGFSQRDEFGDHLHPSDEMWEAFVDGAAQRYRDVADGP